MEDRLWDVALMLGSAIVGVALSELVGVVKKKAPPSKRGKHSKGKR